jgi:quercetin dioxygenase-like cupin family protein
MSSSCCSETGQIPSGEAVNLVSLVEYAPESIVSRQLTKNEAGTITLFAFDMGQSLSEHSAPFDAVVQVLDGQAELVIGGKSVPAQVGQMVVMPADVPHAVKAPQKFKMLLTMLRAKNET